MSLATGTRLGPYEVLGPLGAGGMGEVYRAKDTRLDRSVAIKVLPAHLSSNPDLRARFEREARAVSSLNHPHICVLHDVGHQDGTDYIVMELVEGETLLDRLKKGALPLDQTLRYGIEIADALDKAHRHGVVHRDLKPGNVMLTKTGSKLMDFGLAKRGLAVESSGGVSALPTQERPLTEAGSLLGTFQYMSPEQLEGKDADARADLWALGCVLYEMATGKRAFEGKSQASLISAIMTSEPQPIAQLQPMTPPALDRLVKVCLAKDPDDRLQTAHDVMQELKWIAEGGAGPASGQGAQTRGWRDRLAWAAGGAAVCGLVVAVGSLALGGRQPAVKSRVMRLDIAAPKGISLGTYLALAPDGRHLALMGTDTAGKAMLWVRALDSETAKPVSGTEGGRFPFWSPDSREIAFYAGNKLKRVDLAGGSPQTICDSPEGRGGTWNAAGEILFTPDCCSGLSLVPASGGAPRPLTALDLSRGELSHRWPRFLPDGRHFLYTVQMGSGGAVSQGVYVSTLGSSERKQLTNALTPATFEPPDRLFYVKEGQLVNRRFDPDRLEFASEAMPVAEHVASDTDVFGLWSFTTSSGGVVAYRAGGQPQTRLTWFDRRGKGLGTIGEPGAYHTMALSPDDGQLAVVQLSPSDWSGSLWLLEMREGRAARFTFEDMDTSNPIWSSDGADLLFSVGMKGLVGGLYRKPTAGGTAELVLQGDEPSLPDDWSSDGRFVLYERVDPKTRTDLWMLPLFGERKPQPLLSTPASESDAKLSPDGKWIAYTSDALGRAEVFVQPFPAGAGRWQVSTQGGREPLWRRDGKELFYLSLDRKLMAAATRSLGERFETATPEPLFTVPLLQVLLASNPGHYAVSADGQRILINVPLAEAPPVSVLVDPTSMPPE